MKQDRNRLIQEAKFQSVVQSFLMLKKKEEDIDIDSFLNYYQVHQAFTPKQLATIIWRLGKYNVPYQKSCLKMKMRRDREKRQFI